MTCPVQGALSYLHLVDETAWGDIPASPSWYYLPVTQWDVFRRPEMRRSAVFCGLRQRKHAQVFRGGVSGSIACPLYGWDPAGAGDVSLAQKVIEWGFSDQEEVCPLSKTAEWAVGPDVANRRAFGLRCNTATVSGDAESGAVMFSAELMGKAEEVFSTATALPDDQEKLVEFEFADTLLELDMAGGTSYSTVVIANFEWAVQRNLQMNFRTGSRAPVNIVGTGEFAETLRITLDKTASTWDAIRNDLDGREVSGRLTLKGLHNGTGGSGDFTQVVVVFPRLSFVDAAVPGDRGMLSDQISFDVLKPDTSANAHTRTWSTPAATTTSTTTAS